MPFEIKNGKITVTINLETINLEPDRFGFLAQSHLNHVHGTIDLEAQAVDLVNTGLPETKLGPFIKEVCKWGGYAGISGRILKKNSLDVIRNYFLRSLEELNTETPNLREALNLINHINGLGTPSFASKHLRFLRPDICPVLDSNVSISYGYEFDSGGYAELSQDCIRIADILKKNGMINPLKRKDGEWFAAEVEMALFAYLMRW